MGKYDNEYQLSVHIELENSFISSLINGDQKDENL